MNANFKIPRDSKGRVDIHLFKEAYVESHRLFSDGKRLYLRDESTRLYRILPKEGNKELLKILKKEFLMEDEQSASINDELRRVVSELLTDPRIEFTPDEELRHPEYINVKNGIVDLNTGDLLEKANLLNIYFDYILDFSYQKGCQVEKLPPVLENSLKKSRLSSESIEDFRFWVKALMETIGYIISDNTEKRKSGFFVGATRSGKSTLAELVSMIVLPASKVKHYTLGQMAQNFSTANVASAKLNISDELDVTTNRSLELFKTLVSGSEMSLQQKYDQDIEIRPRVKLLFCCNGLPNFRSMDIRAVIDRMLVIDFPQTVPENERDDNLVNKLYDERDVIFSIAVQAYIESRKVGFTKLPAVQEMFNALITENDSLENFIAEIVEACPEGKVATNRLYEAYTKYCVDNAVKAKTRNELKAAIITKIPDTECRKVRDKEFRNGASVQGIAGIMLKRGW